MSLFSLMLVNPITVLFSFLLISGFGAGVSNLLIQWMDQRHQLRLEDQKTRRLEALARMDEPDRHRLLETMPDWLDKNDPEDVEAWKKARRETLNPGKNT